MNRNKWSILIIFLLLVTMSSIFSCRNTAGKSVTFKTVSEVQSWRVGEGAKYLVVTGENWSSYYPAIPLNADFDGNIYFVASLGTKPNLAYTIKLSRVNLIGDKVTIKVELGEPVPGRVYPQLLVYPIVVAEISKNQLPTDKLLNFVFVNQKDVELVNIKLEI